MSGSRQPRSAISSGAAACGRHWPTDWDGISKWIEIDVKVWTASYCLSWLAVLWLAMGAFTLMLPSLPQIGREFGVFFFPPPSQCIDTSSWIPDRTWLSPNFFSDIFGGPHRKTPATAFWDFRVCIGLKALSAGASSFIGLAVGRTNPSRRSFGGPCTGPGDRTGPLLGAMRQQAGSPMLRRPWLWHRCWHPCSAACLRSTMGAESVVHCRHDVRGCFY